MTDFSKALRELQGSRTPTEFAHELGVSQQTLWRWLAGLSTPRSPLVLQMLEAHGIDRAIVLASRSAS